VSYHQCIENAVSEAAQLACNPPGNYFDSVLALDLDTGAVVWSKQALPYDTWNVACAPFLLPGGGIITDNCAYENAYEDGPDFDFGQAPILHKVQGRDRVGVGQKSGDYWSLDPDTGAVIWRTQTGPGGIAGGNQWGSAADRSAIYTSNANSQGLPWILPNNTLTNAGIFSAIDSRTGAILWQTANPSAATAGAPASVANGVMYACSGSGAMYALNAKTGAVRWTFESGAPCGGGASVADGTVYWSTGYSQGLGGPALGTPGVYAFAIPAP
jgi:polyvinyl alcohol dehydrogenase (cytochrome)